MRVLFLATDTVSAQVRISPLLECLRRSGEIEQYACVDRDMAADRESFSFDVCLVHRNPSTRQIAWLRRSGVPFIYDVDDLLLESSMPFDRRRIREQEAIRYCLSHARYVTSPSRRLLVTLERRLPVPLMPRAVYVPNAGFESRTNSPVRGGPRRLLWASSHGVHYEEFCSVAKGAAAAANVIKSQVVLVGRFSAEIRMAIPDHIHVPWVEPSQFRQFLIEQPTIALAPLPVALAAEAQEFVDCKSDIKAAQFGSIGMPALYSPAPPYTESDLSCTLASSNLAAEWKRRLIELAENFPRELDRIAGDQALGSREPEIIARQFGDVLRRVCVGVGSRWTFRSRPTPAFLRRTEQGLRSLRNRIFRHRKH